MTSFVPQDYNTGICDCLMDFAGCADAWCCTPCQLARQDYAVARESAGMDTTTCLCYTCFSGFIPFFACCIRQRINDAYKIQEAGIATFAFAFCIPVCSIAQGYRELSIRGAWPGGCFTSTPFEHPTIPTQPTRRFATTNVLPQQQVIVVQQPQQPVVYYQQQPQAGYAAPPQQQAYGAPQGTGQVAPLGAPQSAVMVNEQKQPY